jgi:hypothetical protein
LRQFLGRAQHRVENVVLGELALRYVDFVVNEQGLPHSIALHPAHQGGVYQADLGYLHQSHEVQDVNPEGFLLLF